MRKNLSPEVSIVLPVFNRERYISHAIRSILSQTYKDFELIIVNDGSIDKADEIIRRIQDPRIIYVCHKANKGQAAARNTAIKIARGRYIAYCDSDDLWYRNHLSTAIRFLKDHPGVGLVSTDRLLKEGNSIRPSCCAFAFSKINIEIADTIGNTPTIVHKRACLRRSGLFDESKILKKYGGEDWDLWLRISDYYRCQQIKIVTVLVRRTRTLPFKRPHPKSYIYILNKRIKRYKIQNRLNFYKQSCLLPIICVLASRISNINLIKKLIDQVCGNKSAGFIEIANGLYMAASEKISDAEFFLKKGLDILEKKYTDPGKYLSKNINLIRVQLAKIYLKNERWDEALRLARKILRHEKDNLFAHELFAKYYLKIGRFKSAVCIAKRYKTDFLLNLLGVFYYRHGDYNKAKRCFTGALFISSDFYPARKNLEMVERLAI
jgi:glycosyltransferase involved in cell wall biosynthesis